MDECLDSDCPALAKEATMHLLEQLPRIRQLLKKDIPQLNFPVVKPGTIES